MKKTVLALFLFVSAMQLSAQGTDPLMKKFFKASGSEASFKNVIILMMNNFKTNPAFATIPDEFWTEFAKEAEESYGEVEMKIAEVYQQHFTNDEIKQLIAFYESPIGKKLVQEQPAIQADSYKYGSEWGQKLGAKIVEKIQKKKD